MANEQNNGLADMQYLLSDLNTRIRDAEERNRITKERTLLIGKNLIETREEVNEELKKLKQQNIEIKREIEKLKKIAENLINETGKYIKREEIMLIERMLKDFQPLEFVRMKDLDDIIKEKLKRK